MQTLQFWQFRNSCQTKQSWEFVKFGNFTILTILKMLLEWNLKKMFCSQNNLGSKKSETWKKKILDPKKPRGLKVFKRSQDYSVDNDDNVDNVVNVDNVDNVDIVDNVDNIDTTFTIDTVEAIWNINLSGFWGYNAIQICWITYLRTVQYGSKKSLQLHSEMFYVIVTGVRLSRYWSANLVIARLCSLKPLIQIVPKFGNYGNFASDYFFFHF